MTRNPHFLVTLQELILLVAMVFSPCLQAAPPIFETVLTTQPVTLPADFGAHPNFRTEWWYATGWIETADHRPLGFQVTFFRSATEHDRANPSAFAPTQVIVAHAALSDPSLGHLLHDQRAARAGFGLAYAATADTDLRLDSWTFKRQTDGSYQATIAARDFTLKLLLRPSEPPMLQGQQGYSQKGPRPSDASHYYSQPQLRVSGTLQRNGAPQPVSGTAWLDHEWSSTLLDPDATGWDWLGANLDDGGALMAFQIRRKQGGPLWRHAAYRDRNGQITQFDAEQVHFAPTRRWHSDHTGADYPIAGTIQTGTISWSITPLQDDQELDSRQSTGAVYWEGAVTVRRDGQPAGRGYLELTGYVNPLKL